MMRMVYVPKTQKVPGDSFDLGYTFDLEEARRLCRADLEHMLPRERERSEISVWGWELDVSDGETAKEAYDRAAESWVWAPDPDFYEPLPEENQTEGN